jgi:hypothetical protein
LLVWVVGLAGATQGCQTVEILHRPDIARTESTRLGDGDMAKKREAFIDTVLAFRSIVTPLAVGQLLLASLLTLTAGLTLLGRGQARQLAVQAMLVYLLFLPVDYLVRRPVRAVTIDALADGTFPPVTTGPPVADVDQRVVFWWAFRGALGLQLAVLSVGLFAMTRPRVRAFFNAMSGERAHEQEP